MAYYLQTRKKKTTGDVKIRGSLGYSDCKIGEFSQGPERSVQDKNALL